MKKFSLINVSERNNGKASGNWIQDVTGTKEEAFKRARATEKANSNRINVAVVERVNSSTPDYEYVSNVKEIIQ